MLEVEKVGSDHLLDQPILKPTVEISSGERQQSNEGLPADKLPNIVGFVDVKDDEENDNDEVSLNCILTMAYFQSKNLIFQLIFKEVYGINQESDSESEEGANSEDFEEADENDEEGWITPRNFAQVSVK